MAASCRLHPSARGSDVDWELADIFRRYGQAYRQRYRPARCELRVMRAVELCRTAYLGGHLERCDSCGHERPVYNSCRNRHCPKCQARAKECWLEARKKELLPVNYFHLVFTVPHELNRLAALNKRLLYDIVFSSAAETLRDFGADPKHRLRGQLGFTAILHTWDQQLRYHIHLHCVVAGGALAKDLSGWSSSSPTFLFPVKALSRCYRGRFLDKLADAQRRGALRHTSSLPPSAATVGVNELVRRLRQKDWVVYCKPPFGGPAQVLDYLARYTHRVAISNHRLLDARDGYVSFTYRDRRNGNLLRSQRLPADEFIRRFLMHTLPKSFTRIRHFGFLANRHKETKLAVCRRLLAVSVPASSRHAVHLDPTALLRLRCPTCGNGTMITVMELPPARDGPVAAHALSAYLDSS